MTLTIGAIPYSQWHALTPLLEHLGWNQSQNTDVETWYQRELNTEAVSNSEYYLLFHSRPELVLARALELGQSLEQAYTDWEEAVEKLLAFYKRNRSRAVLLDATAVCEAPTKLLNWLKNNRPELSAKVTGSFGENSIATPAASPTLLVVASLFVSSQVGAEERLAQLEATSIPLNDQGYVATDITLSAVVSEYKKHESSSELLDETRNELSRVQKKLATTSNTFTIELNDSKAENELLTLQLHQVQEELEQTDGQRQKLDQRLEQAISENNDLQIQKASLIKESKNLVSRLEMEISDSNTLREERNAVAAQKEGLSKIVVEQDQNIDELKTHLSRTQSDLESFYTRAEQLENNAAASKKEATNQIVKLKRELKAAEHQQRVLNNELAQIRKSVAWRIASPFHAITGAAKLVHSPSRQRKRLIEQAGALENSSLFDAGWYIERYPDVASVPTSPAVHYLMYGASEGRDPSEHFSTNWYLKQYRDVAQSGLNPLLHYIQYGEREGRLPRPKLLK